MNWNLVIGPVSVLLGALVALYVKDKARDVSEVEFAKNIKAALAEFKMELLDSLSDQYVRHTEATLREEYQKQLIAQLSNRLDIHNERIEALEDRTRRN